MTRVCFRGDELHFSLVGVWLFKLGMLFVNGRSICAVRCYEFVVDCEYITVYPAMIISDLGTDVVDQISWCSGQ
jgi:hypothetical protein